MAENNAPEVKLNENPEGTVSFATDVVATIAGLAANEIEGVASMTSATSSLADILTRKASRNYTKGVRVDISNNKVSVDVNIVVEYGSPVPDVARNIQENVKKAIETMSGLDVKNVDVHVQAVSFERENQAAAELDEQQRKLLNQSTEEKAEEKPVEVAPEEEIPEDVEPEEALPDEEGEEIPEEDLEFDLDLPEAEEEDEKPADEQ